MVHTCISEPENAKKYRESFREYIEAIISFCSFKNQESVKETLSLVVKFRVKYVLEYIWVYFDKEIIFKKKIIKMYT